MKLIWASLVIFLVSGNYAYYPTQIAMQFCEYWQQTPIYKELNLDNKCTKMVFSNHKMLCLIRMSDVDLYEVKTCRKISEIELWATSLYEDDMDVRYGQTQSEILLNYCEKVKNLVGYHEFKLDQHCLAKVMFVGSEKVCVLVSQGIPDIETCRFVAELKPKKSKSVKSANLVKMSTTRKPISVSEFETTFRSSYDWQDEPKQVYSGESFTTELTQIESVEPMESLTSQLESKLASSQKNEFQGQDYDCETTWCLIGKWILNSWDEALVYNTIYTMVIVDKYYGWKINQTYGLNLKWYHKVFYLITIWFLHRRQARRLQQLRQQAANRTPQRQFNNSSQTAENGSTVLDSEQNPSFSMNMDSTTSTCPCGLNCGGACSSDGEKTCENCGNRCGGLCLSPSDTTNKTSSRRDSTEFKSFNDSTME